MVVIGYALLLIIGLSLLWWSGELTVKYAIATAHIFNLSMFFIGFIVISISTGLPELAITITSLFYGVHQLSVGTILGSNFSDVALVLGLPAFFIRTLLVQKDEYKECVFMLGLSAAVMAFVFLWGELYWWTGILLILVYLIALATIWRLRKIRKATREYFQEELKPEYKPHEISVEQKILVFGKLLASGGLVLLGSHLSIVASIALAKHLPWTIGTIGSTIMAVGTSLPELIIAFFAARRKEYALAIGTSFGSVLEQGTLILGILALFSHVPISITQFRHLAPFMFISFAIAGYGIIRRERINRREGGSLILLYLIFLVYEFLYTI